jgi:hypothetical protein
MKGDDHVVTPFKDKVMSTLTKLAPDSWTVERVE